MNDYESRTPVFDFGKRKYEDSDIPSSSKRRPYSYYIRLESESSITSESEESILTIQDQETEVVRDSSDTDTKSEDSDYELVEYEVASLSENDDQFSGYLSTSSGNTNEIPALDIEEVVAAVLDGSLDAWITDAEYSSASATEEDDSIRADYRICAQCRHQNDNPRYRLCTACFQKCWRCKMAKDKNCFPLCSTCYKVRKKFYPPRPRRPRKQRTPEGNGDRAKVVNTTHPVDIRNLKTCLDGLTKEGLTKEPQPQNHLSQDSGLGSSQELSPLELEKIIVPDNLAKEMASTASSSAKRKRKDSDESDEFFKPKKVKFEMPDASVAKPKPAFPDEKELCIICNVRTTNSAFLHGNSAHKCCCYVCAKQSWMTHKKCPICSRKVKNVIKVY